MHTSCMAGSEYRHNRKVSQALSGKRAIAMTVALEPNSPCNSHSEQTNKHLWVQWHELNVRKYEHVNSKYTSKPSSYFKVSEEGGDIQSCTSWACTGLEGQSQSWTGLVIIPLPCRGQWTPVSGLVTYITTDPLQSLSNPFSPIAIQSFPHLKEDNPSLTVEAGKSIARQTRQPHSMGSHHVKQPIALWAPALRAAPGAH